MRRYYEKHPKEQLPEGMKKCSKCGELKPANNEYFGNMTKSKDGLKPSCKDCRRATEYLPNREAIIEKTQNYYKENKERVSETVKAYRIKNIEWYQEYNRKYYGENMEKIKESSKRSLYRRIENDYGFKILQRLRKRMYEAVKGNVKSARTQELIGCSVEALRSHLESRFKDGMTWENYGEWHVDHIIPCSSFDFTNSSEQFECFNYKNLQPLWAAENIRKSNKMPTVV